MRYLLPCLSSLVFLFLLPQDADAARRHHHRKHHRHHAKKVHHPYVHPLRVVVKAVTLVPAQRCPGPDQVWVSGHPGPGNQWVTGHCQHVGRAPRAGWTYVSGYWNGRAYVSGFWRPQLRVGFTWVDPHVNDQQEYITGYWEPEGAAPDGMMWRSGYFDGTDWISGGWVPTESYSAYDEDGELVFFAVGDGHVEELAIPDAGIDTAAPYDIGASDLAVESVPVEGEVGPQERHASVPD